MSFPLLRLPVLATINVIKNLDVGNIVHLTQTSPKMRRLVKISKVHIQLIVYPYCVRFEKIAERGEFFDLPCLDRSETAETPQKMIAFEPIYIHNEVWISRREEGYRKMIDDVNDIFIIQELNFNLTSTSTNVCNNYLEYAKSIGLKPTTVQTMLSGANEEIYRRLLTSCSHIQKLTVRLSSTEDFRFDGFNGFTVDDFRLYISAETLYPRNNWFTFDHLCTLINCRLVIIYNIDWRNWHLNQFLKFWMNSNGRLKSLDLWIWELNLAGDNLLDSLFNGIENREIIENEKFEIQRKDGVKAHVTRVRGQFSLDAIIDE